jgi:hypothetical protein
VYREKKGIPSNWAKLHTFNLLETEDKKRSIIMNLDLPQKQQSDMLGYPLVDKENEPLHFKSITRHATTKVS